MTSFAVEGRLRSVVVNLLLADNPGAGETIHQTDLGRFVAPGRMQKRDGTGQTVPMSEEQRFVPAA